MRKISAVIISFMLIITAMAPISFAEISAAFSFSKSLTTDEHYPGELYEYHFNPDADIDDITMTFSITSGSNAIKNLKFTKGENDYILSFSVSPSVIEHKNIDFEVTCRAKNDSSNKSTIKESFSCGYTEYNELNSNGDKEFNIDNNTSVYKLTDNIDNAKLIFDNGSYFETDIDKSGDKINLHYTKNAIVDIANNTDAELYFMNFIASPTLGDTGTFYLYAPDAKYVYSYNGSILTPISAITDDDFIIFKTRTLGNYIASDKQLTDAASTSASSSSSSTSSQKITSSSSSSMLLSSSSSSSKSQSAKISSYVTSGKTNPGTGASEIA